MYVLGRQVDMFAKYTFLVDRFAICTFLVDRSTGLLYVYVFIVLI